MTIIVMSDSHGDFGKVLKIADNNADADMFIHLGDGERDVERVLSHRPEYSRRFICLSGNSDFGTNVRNAVISLGGIKVYIVHGEMLHVKTDLSYISNAARAHSCGVTFFGHTHRRVFENFNGVTLLCPGSCSLPRDGGKPGYAEVTVENGELSVKFRDVYEEG